ncbi:hypothetical protein Ade02nite_27870 [Paractinoplanes deccanensis]|uniref:SMI1/KNR4 family protein n=1 Tax=Paractinoplanes deccanensis TaxID=113561 RepID=A0ABQ3Y2C3_9ACTN|nr:hypothetical protein Ade02nite_27870 [Actinoplanes deccanensis]
MDDSETTTLWRPTGQAELDLVAASGWRAWPPRLPDQPIFYPVLQRWYATKIAREWNVPAGGVGHVTRFDVRRSYLDRHEVRQAGGRDVLEYRIPAGELDEFNAHIAGVIVEEAEFRGPVGDDEFAGAPALPAAWRAYLQSESWFRRGWLESGAFVELHPPRWSAELLEAWEEAAGLHPGLAIIGGNGSREQLVLDLREDDPPVLLVDITSDGWHNAIPQAAGVAELIERVEAGTFDFDFTDPAEPLPA